MLNKDEEIEEMRKQIVELSVMCMVLEKATPRRREIAEKKETDCKYVNTCNVAGMTPYCETGGHHTHTDTNMNVYCGMVHVKEDAEISDHMDKFFMNAFVPFFAFGA